MLLILIEKFKKLPILQRAGQVKKKLIKWLN